MSESKVFPNGNFITMKEQKRKGNIRNLHENGTGNLISRRKRLPESIRNLHENETGNLISRRKRLSESISNCTSQVNWN